MGLEIAVLALFSLVAHLKQSSVVWIITAAGSFFTGWYWYDTFGDNYALAFSVLFFIYGLFCFGEAIRELFFKDE